MSCRMLDISCRSERIDKWNTLLDAGVAQTWLPCMVDAVLNAEGEQTICDFIMSKGFLDQIREKLSLFYDFYAGHGLDPAKVTNKELLTATGMDLFGEAMTCKLQSSKKYNLNFHPLFKTEDGRKEIKSVCLHCIYEKIYAYDPRRGGFEGFLFNFAFMNARSILLKECNREYRSVSLDAPRKSHDSDDGSFHDQLSADNRDSLGVEEVEIDLEKTGHRILVALNEVLDNPQKWDFFYSAIYGEESLDEMAAQEGVSSSAISQRAGGIQKAISHKLGGKKKGAPKVHFRTFLHAFKDCLSEKDFLENVPRPAPQDSLSERVQAHEQIVESHAARQREL